MKSVLRCFTQDQLAVAENCWGSVIVSCCSKKLVAQTGDSSGNQRKGSVHLWKPLPSNGSETWLLCVCMRVIVKCKVQLGTVSKCAINQVINPKPIYSHPLSCDNIQIRPAKNITNKLYCFLIKKSQVGIWNTQMKMQKMPLQLLGTQKPGYPKDGRSMLLLTFVTTYHTTLCHSPEAHDMKLHHSEYLYVMEKSDFLLYLRFSQWWL
jgi:hypothetical protein